MCAFKLFNKTLSKTCTNYYFTHKSIFKDKTNISIKQYNLEICKDSKIKWDKGCRG